MTFVPGQWIRLKRDGNLYRVSDFDRGVNLWALSGVFGTFADSEEMELALPRVGENWEFVSCAKHSEEARFFVADQNFTLQHAMAVWCLCGCAKPVNYGRAIESPVEKPCCSRTQRMSVLAVTLLTILIVLIAVLAIVMLVKNIV